MGLKQDLINAKINAAKDVGITEPLETGPGSYIEREAEYIKEAIAKLLVNAKFTITELKAPIIVENLKTPDQIVDVKKDTITKEKEPLFKTIRQLGSLIPGALTPVNLLVDQVEITTDSVADAIIKEGATLRGLDMSKDGRQGIMGGLISNGYVYIGEDPESLETFDVSDTDGQRDYTEVRVFRQDIEDLL